MKQLARSALSAVERISNYETALASAIVVAMVIIMAYGTVMRYVFRQGIAWAFEVPTFAFFLINALGLAYVQLKRKHLSIDLLVMRLPEKVKHLINAISGTVFIVFCVMVLLAMATRVPIDWVMRTDQARIPLALLDILLCVGLATLILQLLIDVGKELVDLSHKS